MFLFGPPNVEKLKKKRNLEGLVNVLTSRKEPALRRAAAQALGEIGDPRAADPLLTTLSDEAVSVRFAAVAALAALGEPRAIEPLLKLLYQEKEDRDRIIRALTKIDAVQAADRLVARLVFRHGSGETLELLLQFGPVAVESLITRLERETKVEYQVPLLQALAQIGTDRAVAYMAQKLPEAGYWLAPEIGEALGRTGHDRAITPLIAALSRSHTELQRRAIKALGQLKGPQAIDPLLEFLSTNDKQTRACALNALQAIGGQGVPEKLAEALASAPYPGEISQALGKMGAPAVEPLLNLTQKGFRRTYAIEALGQIGDPRAVARLVVLLQDEDERVRRAAAEALQALGWQPDRADLEVSYLLAAQKWERLVELGEVALEPLAAALHDKSWQIRRGSAQTLGQIGNSRAVVPLLATLEDDNVEVWLAAVDALDKLGWQPDRADHGLKLWIARQKWTELAGLGKRQPVVALLVTALESETDSICAGAALTLGRIGHPAALEPLIAALQRHRWDAHLGPQIVRALGQLGDTRAVEPLIETLHYGGDSAGAAVEALVALGRPAIEPLLQVYRNKEARLCGEIFEILGRIGGSQVVEALLPALGDRDGIQFTYRRRTEKVCRVAARALVVLYQAGNIDPQDRQKILARREQMTAVHRDSGTNRPHEDEMRTVEGWCIAHVDTPAQTHTDTGIGIDFPL